MTLPADADLIEALVAAAIEAGAIILDVRGGGLVGREEGRRLAGDRSRPRRRGDDHRRASPRSRRASPVIAEEAVYEGRIPETGRAFFLVDPLDGTREFVKGGDDFTVNIGLVRDGAPVVGVIFVPATGKLYAGAVGEGAWRAEVDGRRRRRAPADARPPAAGRADRRRRQPLAPHARRPTPSSPATRSAGWSRPARR